MRWQFIIDEQDPDFTRKESTTSKIKSWWTGFPERANALVNSWTTPEVSREIASSMGDALHLIDEGLMWECNRSEVGGYDFAITCEDRIELRSLANSVVALAPPTDGWQFYPYRLPEIPGMLNSALEVRLQEKIPKDLTVTLAVTEHKQIDLLFKSKSFKKDNDDIGKCMLIADICLGEEASEKFVNCVWTAKRRGLKALIGKLEEQEIQIRDLNSSFKALYKQLFEQLPDKPLIDTIDLESSARSVISLKKNVLPSSSPPTRVSCVSFLPQVFIAAISHNRFFSECHSKFGETFCYLKLTRPSAIEDALHYRARIEDATDAALRERGVGCVVGGGWGPWHDFIELALTDVIQAIPILRGIASQLSLARNSWLLFYDLHLAEEWVGLYSESPAPKLEKDEL